MNTEFLEAIESLERERHMSKDMLIEAIESALVSAYKKNYGKAQNVRVDIDRVTGDINVYMRRDIVEVVEDPFSQASLEEAQEIDPEYEIGDVIEYQVTPKDFGRIAAQTAKQVVVQRIREAERGMIFDDYSNRQGEIVTGRISRISNDTVYVNIDRVEGILSKNEQIPSETYRPGDRMKLYVMDVKKSNKGPQVFLSRSHPGLVKKLFELEVPEIQDKTIEIKNVSREAGSRSKIAVCTYDENVDPVGSCVGPRGARVQAVVDALGGEKIDIINWSTDYGKFIAASLAPSEVEYALINEAERSAVVVVPDSKLSLAIGKDGQNVRLAARLCSWKIDIKSHSQYWPDGHSDIDTSEPIIEYVTDVPEVAEDNAEDDAVDFVSDDKAETSAVNIKKMKKAELVEYAQSIGIELDPKLKNAEMIDIISAALAGAEG